METEERLSEERIRSSLRLTLKIIQLSTWPAAVRVHAGINPNVREPLFHEGNQFNACRGVCEAREIPRWVTRNNQDFVEVCNRLFNITLFG